MPFIVQRIINVCNPDSQMGLLSGQREYTIGLLHTHLVESGLLKKGKHLSFLCSQIVATAEEVIDDNPFGEKEALQPGYGGDGGLELMDCAAFEKYLNLPTNTAPDVVYKLGLILKVINTLDDDNLSLLGCE